MDGDTQSTQVQWPNGHGKMIKRLRVHGNVCRACRETGVKRETYYDWLDRDPEYKSATEEARAAGRMGFRDAAVDYIYRSIEEDTPDITAEGLRTAVRVLAQLEPAVWSEKSRTEVSGPDGGPIPVSEVVIRVVSGNAP